MIQVNGLEIEVIETEFGVLWDDGEVSDDMTEAEAREILGLAFLGGRRNPKLVARHHFTSGWAEVAQ